MDSYEATQIVLSRIQTIDPENASKIMGSILIQDNGEKEMIRLAFCPDALLLSYINQVKSRLANPPPSNPTPPIPIRPRIMVPRTPSLHFYGGGFAEYDDPTSAVDHGGNNPVMSPGGMSDSLVFPYSEDVSGVNLSPHGFHRRSFSVNDAAFLANLDDGVGVNGLGWKPCMYFARGFCKNGSGCKFLHSDSVEGTVDVVGSPSNNAGGGGGSGFEELMRLRALQQQRLALMASGVGNHHHAFGYNRCMDLLEENPRSDFSPMGFGGPNSSSRQIYLTFPADSTFREEDVSSYFSMYGPVQDVRIPYQQKRMFGFVTFVYPETVKLILAKGNPHFVCDSRVLVKPYKEKGKIRDKKQHQHLERGENAACLSPPGIDYREQFDLHFGSRMLLGTQEMILRRKLEHDAELQYAIERKMMNIQLMDLNNQNHNRHFLPNSPPGMPNLPPRQSPFLMNQTVVNQEDDSEVNAEFDGGGQEAATSPTVAIDEKPVLEGIESSSTNNNGDDGNKPLQPVNADTSDLPESLEDILPDNLFAPPTISERYSGFSQITNNAPLLPDSSPLTMASLRSCYIQPPRFTSGQEAIEM